MRNSNLGVAAVVVAASVLAAGVVAACGGGGTLDVVEDAGTTTVSGGVWKGAVSGATVIAYALGDDFGRGRELATATTSESGAFVLPELEHTGNVLLVAKGGAYKEEAVADATVQLGADELTAVLLGYQPGRDVSGLSINPVTHLETVLAGLHVRTRQRTVADAVSLAHDAVDAHFGGVAWRQVAPADLTATRGAQLDDAAKAGLVLAGLSMQARMLSERAGLTPGSQITAMTLVKAYAEDLIGDGFFDGVGPTGPIIIPVGGVVRDPPAPSAYRMDDHTARSHLAIAIRQFVASARNGTAIAAADVEQFTDAISRNSNLTIFRTGGSGVDTAIPTVVWTVRFAKKGTPTDVTTPDGLVAGQVTVTALASDPSGMDLLNVTVEGAPLTPALGNSPTQFIGTWDTRAVADGALTFTAQVRDRAAVPNSGTATFRVLVDNTKPSVVVTSPSAAVSYSGSIGIAAASSDVNGLDSFGVTSGLSGFLDADDRVGTIGGFWSPPTSGPADSSVEAAFTACDLAGNCATQTIPTKWDRTPPSVVLVTEVPRYVGDAGTPLQLEVTAADTAGVKKVFARAGGDAVAGSYDSQSETWRVSLPIAAGENTVYVWAEDLAEPANTGAEASAPHRVSTAVLLDGTEPTLENPRVATGYRSEQTIALVADGAGNVSMPPTFSGLGDPVSLALGDSVHKSLVRLGQGTTPTAQDIEGANSTNTPWLRFRASEVAGSDAPIVSATFSAACASGCSNSPAPATGALLLSARPSGWAEFDLPINAVTVPWVATQAASALSLTITVTVTDAAGNSQSLAGALGFNLVAPPIAWAQDDAWVSAADPQSVYGYKLATATYDDLFAASGNPYFQNGVGARVVRIKLQNPFSLPLVVTAAPTGTPQWTFTETWTNDAPQGTGTSSMDGFTFNATEEYWSGASCAAAQNPPPCTAGQRHFHSMGMATKYGCTGVALPNDGTQAMPQGGWDVRGFLNPATGGNEQTATPGSYAVEGVPAIRVPAASGNMPGAAVLYIVAPRGRPNGPPLTYQQLTGQSSARYQYLHGNYYEETGTSSKPCPNFGTYQTRIWTRRGWYRYLTGAQFAGSGSYALKTQATADDGSGSFPAVGPVRAYGAGSYNQSFTY